MRGYFPALFFSEIIFLYMQDEKKVGSGPKSLVGSGYPKNTFFFVALGKI